MIDTTPFIIYNFPSGNDLKLRQKPCNSSVISIHRQRKEAQLMKHLVSLMVSLFFVFGMPAINASADVNVNIGINAPPVEFAAPPDVVVVPSGTSYVYMAPETPGIYFYDGFWYRFYQDRWFRATIYSGPWTYVSTSLIPVVVVDIPPDYVRYLPPGYHRIHYRNLNNHWREWRRDRYWNRYDWYRREVRESEKRHREGYKPPRGEHYKPRGGEYKPPRNEGYKQPRGGEQPRGPEHKPAVEGRGVQPMNPYKALQEKGLKQKGEGHKQKGEHEQKGKKGEHGEER
jgi:hypothetical protein